MSTVVFQGLQSFLEPQLLETRTLRLKLATPKPSFFETIELALDKETSYVHPMSPKFSPNFRYKSLELCTETLGSETGTDIAEITAFSLSSLVSEEKVTPAREAKLPPRTESRRVKNSGNSNFPPPLTTISRSSSTQFKAHREGGRLVINAIEAMSARSYFQAGRSHGRLTLSLWKDGFDTSSEVSEVEEIENDGNGEENEEVEECEEELNEVKESEEELNEEVEYEEERNEEGYEEEYVEGNYLDVGVEMGMEKFQRPSKCKEGGHDNEGFCNWEPFWVAT